MVLSAVPALPAEAPEGGAAGRSVTNDSNNLIIPQGETYELYGDHTYKVKVQIDGELTIKPYDGSDEDTGTLVLTAPTIIVGATGSIRGDGRGFGGGGGGTCYPSNPVAGKGGVGGSGGDGANPMYGYAGGGGGGSNGGRGGNAGSYGYHSAGKPGTELGGGEGGGYSGWNEPGGKGGSGYGGGGGGGGTDYYGPGGGGGGGSGGDDGSGTSGGKGDGQYGGKGGTGSSSYTNGAPGKNGGYMADATNGDSTTDSSVVRGSGGGGGGTCNYGCGGAGGGGAGGAALSLFSSGDLNIIGYVSTAGGGGGEGGYYYGRNYPGGRGGGGGGGGIVLFGLKVIISGTVNALGMEGNSPSSENGGTIKLLYGETMQNNGNVQGGRTYVNARPKMKGLNTPLDNDQVLRKPTFKWYKATDPEDDPITYDIELASNDRFNPVSRRKAGIEGLSHTFDSPLSGTMYWHVRAADQCGGGGWSETRRFTVDDKAPTSRIDPMPEYVTTQPFLVSWQGQDNDKGSGIKGYNILVSDNGGPVYTWLEEFEGTSAFFEGIEGHAYRFASQAIDVAENIEGVLPEAWVSTTLDSMPPTGSINAMPPWQSKGKFMVSWSARDTVSGVADYTIYVSIDDGEFEIWLENTTEVQDLYQGSEGHKYTFFMLARDIAGNLQAIPGPEKLITTRVDGTAPVTTLMSEPAAYGENPSYIRQNALIYLHGTDNSAGVNQTFYKIDSRSQQLYTKAFREAQAGSHNITFWSVDDAGNEEEHHVTWFWVDGEVPVTNLLLVGPNWTTETRVYISGSTLVGFDAKDKASGINRTVYDIDGSGEVVYTGPFQLPKSGLHRVRFYSVDNVGLQDTERNVSVVLDTWAPSSVALVESEVSSNDIVVELRGTDLESGLSGVFYRVKKEGEPGMNFVQGTLVTIPSATDHSLDGKYILEYYAVDNVGNKEEVRELELTIDTVGNLEVGIKGSPTVEDPIYHVTGTVEPGSVVMVNGLRVLVKKDGTFDYTLELKEGRNKIVVVATDPAGNSASETKTVTYKEPQDTGALMLPIALVVIIVAVVAVVAFMFLRNRPRPSVSPPPAAAPPQPAPPPVPPAK